jgi:hypothetical protein
MKLIMGVMVALSGVCGTSCDVKADGRAGFHLAYYYNDRN